MTAIAEALDHSACNQGNNEHFCVQGDQDGCPMLWDPWDELKIHCASYNSEVDANAIGVLRLIGQHKFNRDIAAATGLTEAHVELFQYLFCSAGWCDYGTSPRGCFPTCDCEGDRDANFEALIGKWELYYRLKWGEEAP